MYGVEDISHEGIYGPPVFDKALPTLTKAIMCTGAGNVKFIGAHQHDIQTLAVVATNQWIELSAKELVTASTTATIGLVLYRRS